MDDVTSTSWARTAESARAPLATEPSWLPSSRPGTQRRQHIGRALRPRASPRVIRCHSNSRVRDVRQGSPIPIGTAEHGERRWAVRLVSPCVLWLRPSRDRTVTTSLIRGILVRAGWDLSRYQWRAMHRVIDSRCRLAVFNLASAGSIAQTEARSEHVREHCRQAPRAPQSSYHPR